MKPESVLKSIRPALTKEQENRVDELIHKGCQFYSLFNDGSVELLQDGKPVYVERSGQVAA